VLLHNRVRDGQPEPRAFADLLRREERIEDFRLQILSYPGAVVVDLEDDRLSLDVVPAAYDESATAIRREHRLLALIMRFSRTCWTWCASANTWGSPDASASTMVMFVMRCSYDRSERVSRTT
jgi:hypothetical protein